MQIGQRLIMYRSGYSQSGKDGHVCIGEIESINNDYIGIKQWGYDIKELDYILDAYVWGSYPKDKVQEIIWAQPLLSSQFPAVDVNKEPKDFYISEKLIYDSNND